MKQLTNLQELLVKKGILVGYRNTKGKVVYLGQISETYYTSDDDGTGSTCIDSISRLIVGNL